MVALLALLLNLVAVPDVTAEEVRWARELEVLHAARERAFVAGDPEGLDTVYRDRGAEWRADAAAIRAYRERGIAVERLRTVILRVRVVEAAGPRAVLEVVDRVVDARVRMPSGTRRPLPEDRPTARRVELLGTARGWRIDALGAPSTGPVPGRER